LFILKLILSYLLIYFGSTGLWTKGFMLARQALYYLNQLFLLSFFSSSEICFSLSVGYSNLGPHTCQANDLTFFFLFLALTYITNPDFYFLFFFSILELNWVLCSLGRCSTTWATPPAYFGFS
jgi:hypothetical protein